MLRSTATLLYHWPKYRFVHGNGGLALNLKKYAKHMPSEKKTVVHNKMVSTAGHPWYHFSSKRPTSVLPDKQQTIAFDPVVQRNCLFVEKKNTGMSPSKLKWTQ
eukprot:TRINITY_DN53872_c0_g1_i1.p4 TRINITY_DN53872_c0_g1~~TRINITY_DN53872_c0_g1_i1.p4  ORF type:complete len:104 (+),score=36.41 TRINITY_DN53872_c0_g1_i1:108-419(+)